ncbi:MULTISPECIES: plasmid partitioning protein RepB [unclassified Aureimonas]|uniref:plasmid partitioning protein RepB n=1 Tax=unclassified Aureimonas TaxID=2615206 RepID=UPI0006FF89B4|nr:MULTISPECIES: plasmid partitioning protein RepB [unclassified Aureimonas]KQT69089.1 plasmid partitioning protein RepB [Aureimonas sp. Leaf460]KQT69326.1 plasmid partitioning protein RepB [Aureimonas sp. Leaf427]
MSKRKDELRALLMGGAVPEAPAGEAPKVEDPKAAEGVAEPSATPAKAPAPERATSGAVRAMGLALGSLRSGAEEAKALRENLARGEHVVELDPALIEPAFLADRLSPAGEGDESFEALKASIAEGGQEVPVLVRPHPDAAKAKAGYFQAAYGHRRIAATRALGLKVRAVVRSLTDEALVLAQGKENSERRDLSFIERALFCRAMVERGFERRVAQAALGLHKAEMTRLLQVAEMIPLHIAQAIGPAPRAGRPRWMDLAEQLQASEANQVKAQDEMGLERFRKASSDERFTLMLSRMTAKPSGRAETEALSLPGGERLAQIKRTRRGTAIEFGERDFADYVAAELPALHAAYRAAREGPDESG